MNKMLIAACLLSSAVQAQQVAKLYPDDPTPLPAQPAEPGKPAMPWYGTPWEFGYFAASTADMLTTLDIKHKPLGYEHNFIMGAHPNDAQVLGYYLVTDAFHLFVTRELVSGGAPKQVIAAWEVLTIGTEIGYVAHNFSIGLKFSF